MHIHKSGNCLLVMLKQQLRQQLQQKLSPQQIQMIRLLELPAIELEEKVKHELEENPALEEGKPNQDDYEYEDGRDSDDEGTSIDGNNNENADLSLGDYLTEDDIPDYKLQELHDRNDKKEDIPFSAGESLNEYLLEQLGLRELPEQEYKIAEYIIGNIDDDGYLRRDLNSIADDLVFQAGLDITGKDIEPILSLVQDFEPSGVGARDLQECLSIQLQKKSRRK